MDISQPSPRVNGELMARYVGKKVLLVGKKEGEDGASMQLRTADGKMVTVALKQGEAPVTTDFVEFEGMVEAGRNVYIQSPELFWERPSVFRYLFPSIYALNLPRISPF